MRSKFWVILESIMLLLWIIVTAIFLKTVYSDSAKCLANPLVFGVQRLNEENNDYMTCTCQFESRLDYSIIVNKDKWWIQEAQGTSIPITFNFTS